MGIKSNGYVDIIALHPGVTGSNFLCLVHFPYGPMVRFAVDCGLFQEQKYRHLNTTFLFEPKKLDFALVTHNHIDHTGRLPLLSKEQFDKKIYMTKPTLELIGLAMDNNCKVLNATAKRKNESPLYSEYNVSRVKRLFEGVEFEQTISVHENIDVTFYKNGHLVGASQILVKVKFEGQEDINLLFTGDYNSKNVFFDVTELPDEVLNSNINLICEATYGNMNSDEVKVCFENNVLKAISEEKTIVTLGFSLGRSQEILYKLKQMQLFGKLSKDVCIYYDGKLSQDYTQKYLKSDLGIKPEMRDFLPANLIYVNKENRPSVLISEKTKIILTSSGMGTYGPAPLYISKYITTEQALIHFTGYQAEGTLGAALKNTAKGDMVSVAGLQKIKQADVEYTSEWSSHAKADELIQHINKFKSLKSVLFNHGEEIATNALSKKAITQTNAKEVGILGRDYYYRIGPYGIIKTLSSQFF